MRKDFSLGHDDVCELESKIITSIKQQNEASMILGSASIGGKIGLSTLKNMASSKSEKTGGSGNTAGVDASIGLESGIKLTSTANLQEVYQKAESHIHCQDC